MRGISRIEGLLWVVLLAGIGLHLLVREDRTRRNFEVFPDMLRSPAYEAQDPNPNFPDGKTLQTPPAGTIARGYLPLHVGDHVLDVSNTEWKKLPPAEQAAWDALRPPWGDKLEAKHKQQLLDRGEAVFQTRCATCHGAGGTGGTPVTKRGVPPPPSLLAENARGMSDGQMFRTVTAGNNNMPSHAAQVERDDRWKAILYIRSLQAP